MKIEKHRVEYFVSYAHDDDTDDRIVSDLLRNLKKNFKVSKKFSYSGWTDKDILAGEDWAYEIETALKSCDFGILLVSLDFLGSSFILEKELPALLKEKECVIPVGLSHVSIEEHDLKGLQERQIFLYNSQFYSVLDKQGRSQFAYALFANIEKKLLKIQEKNIVSCVNIKKSFYQSSNLTKLQHKESEVLAERQNLFDEIDEHKSTYNTKHKALTKWLSKHRETLSEKIYKHVVSHFEKSNFTYAIPSGTKEIRRFKRDISQNIRHFEVCLLDENSEIIDEPSNISDINPDIYKVAYTFLYSRVPDVVPEDSKIEFKNYIEYFLKRV